MKLSLGIDVGAVSTNVAALDGESEVVFRSYLRTKGDPIGSVRAALAEAGRQLAAEDIAACGTTGSGRHLAAALAGADLVRNEITCHATAALHFFPEARTVIEIGGQDSKIIIIRDGIPVDFAMNAVCAAGTGSFLDYQASRLGISIEDLAGMAAESPEGAHISGRCAVFAESDLIDKQQRGVARGAILRGLCDCLARNFLSGVARGKEIVPPVVFQGGVAANRAVARALERELATTIEVPRHHDVMGAIGVALLAAKEMGGRATRFKGFAARGEALSSRSFECAGCCNRCDVFEMLDSGKLVSRWGSRCGKWDLSE